jgi:hypothetical protein
VGIVTVFRIIGPAATGQTGTLLPPIKAEAKDQPIEELPYQNLPDLRRSGGRNVMGLGDGVIGPADLVVRGEQRARFSAVTARSSQLSCLACPPASSSKKYCTSKGSRERLRHCH